MARLTLLSGTTQTDMEIDITTGVIAGWTGRDRDALLHHIRELEEIGVTPPAFTPIFYRVAAARFTTAGRIECTGADSSGEVEFAVLKYQGRIYIGVGSDHTDRKVEAYDITVSKQMCDKPIARIFWDLADIEGHWEKLMLQSWSVAGTTKILYQEGPVSAMTPPRDLMALYRHEGAGLPENSLMFCGTLPAKGGLRCDARFEFSLHDPVLNRTIVHGYDVTVLPPYAETVGA
jgi:hypothetical protein